MEAIACHISKESVTGEMPPRHSRKILHPVALLLEEKEFACQEFDDLINHLHELERAGSRYGLITLCPAGGMAPATIIELIA